MAQRNTPNGHGHTHLSDTAIESLRRWRKGIGLGDGAVSERICEWFLEQTAESKQRVVDGGPTRFEDATASQRGDMHAIYQVDTTIVVCDDAYARLFGWAVDDLVGRRWIEFVPEKHLKRVRRLLRYMRIGRPSVASTFAIDTDDGLHVTTWLNRPVVHGSTVVGVECEGLDLGRVATLELSSTTGLEGFRGANT